MSTNVSKIRLGAVDSQILDQGLSTQVDLGASTGGAMFVYKPTYTVIEIDQALVPVEPFRTKEELTYETTLVQAQALLYAAATSYPSSQVQTTAASTLAAPASPTVVPTGGAAGAFSYSVVAYNYNGDSIPSSATAISTGPTTLSSVAYNTITWTAVTGAVGYKVQRITGGATFGVATVLVTTNALLAGTLSLKDTGLTTTAYTASVAAPVTPNTDSITLGNNGAAVIRTLDVSQPKNDGTQNHWLWHVPRCYASDQLQVDMKRDKATEYKLKLAALGDPNNNYSLFSCVEQY